MAAIDARSVVDPTAMRSSLDRGSSGTDRARRHAALMRQLQDRGGVRCRDHDPALSFAKEQCPSAEASLHA